MRKSKLGSIIFLVLLFGVPAVVFSQRLHIYDWYRLRGYDVPSKVAMLADDTTMVPSMRRIFYVYHPSIEDKSSFNGHCRSDEKTIVLGCYVNQQGIYLLSVTDERLNGIEQVTAAHESLHAAYARLNKSQKSSVDTMISAAFAGITDQRIKDNVELYRKQNSSIVPNELHSILGTEVATLPANLETYYKQYFSNRAKIVAYSEQYEQAFTDRKNQVNDYDAQLVSLKQRIDALQASLQKQTIALQSERQRMDGLRTSGQIAAYNEAVPGYNAKIGAYNVDIDALSGLVDKYNDIVIKRNEIANEESELAKAIDSRTTVPARQ